MSAHPLTRLLRAYVSGSPPDLTVGDAPVLLQTAQMQNLLPVLAYMDKKWKLFSDEALRARLGRQLRQTLFLHNRRYAAFEQLSAGLSDAGIDHMPVKGWYLRQLYDVPELRTFGDIDVLIRREDRARTHEMMRSLGFTVQTDWEPTYTYARGPELYELHTNLMDASLDGRSDLPAYFADAWSHAPPGRAGASSRNGNSTSCTPSATWPSTSTPAAPDCGCTWMQRCSSTPTAVRWTGT